MRGGEEGGTGGTGAFAQMAEERKRTDGASPAREERRRSGEREGGEEEGDAGNKLSRSFPRAVTDLWFIARLCRGGSSGRQRNERTDVPSAIFPRTGANKVPAAAGVGGAAPSYRFSPPHEARSLGV